MFCKNCGKAIEPDTKFCPHCGAGQIAAAPPPTPPPAPVPPIYASTFPPSSTTSAPATPPPAAARGSKSAIWAGVATLVVALVGGVGYWGYGNKVAGDEAVRKLASDEQARVVAAEDTARKFAEEEQRRVAAEKIAAAAEITAAQALLDKHIAAEEAQAQANAAAPGVAGKSNKGTTIRR